MLSKNECKWVTEMKAPEDVKRSLMKVPSDFWDSEGKHNHLNVITNRYKRARASFVVDRIKKIVYEVPEGHWSVDDYADYMSIYTKDLRLDLTSMKKWVKVLDMRNYITSSVGDLVDKHLTEMKSKGLQELVFIMPKGLSQMQMKRVCDGIVPMNYFDNDTEAWNYAKGLK